MDLPVVLIKLRDYLLWLGPIYLLAVSLEAVLETLLRSRFGMSPPLGAAPGHRLALLAWPGEGRGAVLSGRQSLRLDIWATVSARSVSLSALLLTGALSWPLSLLRLGLSLIVASLLAAFMPAIAGGTATTELALLPVAPPPPAQAGSLRALFTQWWQIFKARFEVTSNGLLVSVALGAALIGLSAQLADYLSVASRPAQSPFGVVAGAVVGTALSPVVAPGMDAAILSAMQTRGLEGVMLPLMLAVAASDLGLLRSLRARFGWKTVALYLLLVWVVASAAAWALSLAGVTTQII